MRLTHEQANIIKQETIAVFGPGSCVRLFGSRVDDQARGGDIDLYIEATGEVETSLLNLKTSLLSRLWQRLGPQRIDLLVRMEQQPLAPIHRDALEQGVLL